MDYISFILGLALLVIGASYFVEYAVSIAKHLRLSVAVFGAVIVAIGTSLPELVVTIEAAVKNAPDIITGNIIGSNITNVGLVLGVAILLGRKSVYRAELGGKNRLLLLLSFAFLCLLQLKWLAWPVGVILLILTGILTFGLTKDREQQQELNRLNANNFVISWVVLTTSLASVIIGSQVVVNSSLAIAAALSVPAGVIAATVIALGTSLPELVITIIAVSKNQHGLALGNILGSNLFNLALVGGVGALLTNLGVGISITAILSFLFFTLALYALASGYLKPKRLFGALIVCAYLVYIILEYITL